MSLGERFLFVGGFPRSGTTLVQNVLDSHPAIYGGPELDLLPTIMGWHEAAEGHRALGRVDEFYDRGGLDAAFRALIDGLLLPAADRAGCELISEKTPLNVMAFRFLLELYPAARAVLVVRDPRAVLASNLKVRARYETRGETPPSFMATENTLMAAMIQVADAGIQAVEAFGDRVFVVRYEQLVCTPGPAIRALAEWLDVPFVDAMLSPHRQRHDGARLASELWNPAATYERPIDHRSLETWRDELPKLYAEVMARTFTDHPLYAGSLTGAAA